MTAAFVLFCGVIFANSVRVDKMRLVEANANFVYVQNRTRIPLTVEARSTEGNRRCDRLTVRPGARVRVRTCGYQSLLYYGGRGPVRVVGRHVYEAMRTNTGWAVVETIVE